MGQGMRRWPLLPVILFLVLGVAQGGADLPEGWGLFVLVVPLALALVQVYRPTVLGWRLAFASFCLLIGATLAINVARAGSDASPSLSAAAGFAAMFVTHFGVAMWLLWLARPRHHQSS